MTDRSQDSLPVRRFILAALPASLVSWSLGFDLGAFDTVSYHRVFSVFVVCAVVLVATFLWPSGDFPTSSWSRIVLALPVVYIIADALWLTESVLVANVLSAAIVLTLPYAAWVVGRLVGSDLIALSRREQVAIASLFVVIGLAGFYVGADNDRFLSCRDFEHMGDYVPANCSP